MKEYATNDTVMKRYSSLFIKTPENKSFGYIFKVDTYDGRNKPTDIDLYNGQSTIHVKPGDNTYEMERGPSFNMQSTIPGWLQWMQSRLDKQVVNTVKVRDTAIRAIKYSHLIATVWDTIIDNERNYTEVNLFISESSGMPYLMTTRSRNTTIGNGVSTYYSEIRCFDYKLNQDGVNETSVRIPDGLHQKKVQSELPGKPQELLSLESLAPAWSLYDSEGKKMSLAQLKGKVVLIDFFFIGCGNCMEALKPLSKLHEKYRNQDVVIVSMTNRDNKKAATEFKKIYNINYPIYIKAGKTVELYKVDAFPTFYFIDREGKIGNAIRGYDADFDGKAASIIDNLLTN